MWSRKSTKSRHFYVENAQTTYKQNQKKSKFKPKICPTPTHHKIKVMVRRGVNIEYTTKQLKESHSKQEDPEGEC